MALNYDQRPLRARESVDDFPETVEQQSFIAAPVAPPAGGASIAAPGQKGDKGDKGDPGEPGGVSGWISVKDYGAVGDGITDDTAAINAAIKACQGGRVSGWIATAFGSGYTWATALNFYRGNTSATGAGVVATDGSGKVNGAIITNVGNEVLVRHIPVSTTAGDHVITLQSGQTTAGLYVGMPIDEPGLTADTYLHTIIDSTHILLNQPCPFSSAYVFLTLGIPRAVIVGDGTGAVGEVILSGKKLLFPPGVYSTTDGLGLFGLHNTQIEGYGATIKVNSTNSSGLYIDYSCRYVTVSGLRFIHPGEVWMPRQPGCGVRNSGWFTTLKDCHFEQCPEFGILYGGPWNVTKYSYGGAIINCRVTNTKGDGIHVSTGFRDVLIQGNYVDSPGDDAIAVVDDNNGTNCPPLNISINGNQVRKGGFRGVIIIGGKKVVVADNNIDGVMGWGIQASDEGHGYPYYCEQISITGNICRRVGSDGAGETIALRHGIVVDHTTTAVVANNLVDDATGYGYYFDYSSNIVFADNMAISCTNGEQYFGGSLTNCRGTYWDSGALKARGGSGTTTTLASP